MPSLDDPAVLAAVAVVIITALALFLISKKKAEALDPDNYKSFVLTKLEQISHDTIRMTFGLGSDDKVLGLPVGQHIAFRYMDSSAGRYVERMYTPTTGDELLGSVIFVIKVYHANVHPKFPDGGKMSQHLGSLKVGDTLEMKGPRGHMTYLGAGRIRKHAHLRKPEEMRFGGHFAMLAGGTGITPMLQIIENVLKNPNDATTLSLLFGNQTEEDILVREELEVLAAAHPDRFSLHYTLDRPPADWKFSTGFITKEMIEDKLLGKMSKGKEVQFLMCGPPLMIKFACIANIEALGYKKEKYFAF